MKRIYFFVFLTGISLFAPTYADQGNERYILSLSAEIHESPSNKSKVLASGWLFGEKNIGSSVHSGGWETFTFESNSSNGQRKIISGWIESSKLIGEKPTEEALLNLFRATEVTRKERRKEIAEIAHGAFPYGEITRAILEEFNSMESEVSAQVKKIKKRRVVFLVDNQAETLMPIVMVDGGKFISPPDGTLTRENDLLPEEAAFRNQYIDEYAFVEAFLKEGTKYKLIRTGTDYGEITVTEKHYPCSTCSGLFATGELLQPNGKNQTRGKPMHLLLATNFSTPKNEKYSSSTTSKEAKILWDAANRELVRRGIPLEKIKLMKPYGGVAIRLKNNDPLALASSFSYTYMLKDKSAYGTESIGASQQFFIFMQKKTTGEYKVAYSRFLHTKDSEMVSNISLVDYIDMDLDGEEDLLLCINGGYEDTWQHFEIIKGNKGKFGKAFSTGFSGVH